MFLLQGVREPVASYQRWQRLGRQVLKGAHAKEAIVPILAREREPAPEADSAAETEEEKRDRMTRLIGFKVVRGVFTYSDTDGPDLPPVQLPKWDADTALNTLAIKRVPFQHLNGNVQGYSVGREIAINPMAVQPAKTLLHEMGHIVLGHTVATSLGEYAQHRGIMEFGAESTAYLAGHELEIIDEETASSSRAYIQHWLQNEHPGDREIRMVFSATERILRAGRVAASQTAESEGY